MTRVVVSYDGDNGRVSSKEIFALRKLFSLFKSIPPKNVANEIEKCVPYNIDTIPMERVQELKDTALEYGLHLKFRDVSDYGANFVTHVMGGIKEENVDEYYELVFFPSFDPECILVFQKTGDVWSVQFATMQASIQQKYFIESRCIDESDKNYKLYDEYIELSDVQVERFMGIASKVSIKDFPDIQRIGCDGMNVSLKKIENGNLENHTVWSPCCEETPQQYNYIRNVLSLFNEFSSNEVSRSYIRRISRYME